MNSIVLANIADYHMHARGVNGTPEEIGNFNSVSWMNQRKLEKANDILWGVGRLQIGFSRILAMPNLLPSHIRNAGEVNAYKESLDEDIPEDHSVGKILTLSLKPETTPEIIEECAKIPEFKAVKYYPGGVTTNSGGSSGDIDPDDVQVKAVFEKMAELGIVLSLHPETTEKKNIFGHITGGFVHNAEREFQTIAEKIAQNHPNLKIVIEHISTAEMANLVGSGRYANVYGSVTPQHLLYTAHDKEGGHAFETHLHCKPTLKNPEDLLAIQKLVLSGNKKVFFGSDSAPHPQDVKECAHCASGVFSSPIAIQAVASWFMDTRTHNWWKNETNEDLQDDILRNRLESFMGTNGQAVYGEPTVNKYVTLEKRGFIIPEFYPTSDEEVKLIPMNAGKNLPWSISKIQVRTQGALRDLDIAPLGQLFTN